MTLMKVCSCVRVFHEECVHAPRCLCVDVRGCCSAAMCLICVCTLCAWVHACIRGCVGAQACGGQLPVLFPQDDYPFL